MAGIIAWREYLVKLCRAIIMYGALKHQLEEYMSMFSRALEIEAWTLLTTGLVWRKQHGGLNLDTVLDRRPKFQVRFLVLTYGLASAFGDVYKFTFDLEGSREHGHVLL
ncbi:hypothetical protein E4U38_005110 [Claviceps purpurea]|nr:hypothetical protein E4U38_005110 [Claviceps purpurea]